MLVKRTVGARGEVVLPKDIREQFGFRPGTDIAFETRENEVAIKPAKTTEEFLKEFFTSSKTLKVKDGAEWISKAIDEEHEE